LMYLESAVSRFHAWFAIRLWDTIPFQSATDASYPKVRIRASGNFDGRRVWGHGDDACFAVQVLSRSPVSLWTNTMLTFQTVSDC
jgi:hypothetical protein